MKHVCYALPLLLWTACGSGQPEPIDREALVTRHNPHVTAFDTLSSLSVGNGEFAFTVDATGLQTFPEHYQNGVPLGTQSQWGWHSFPNVGGYRPEECLKAFDFGRGRQEWYACQFKEPKRQREAADYYRANPHRLHLGVVGLELGDTVRPVHLSDINQRLDMWSGRIDSRFCLHGQPVEVQTVCHPRLDMVAARLHTSLHGIGVKLRFPYPTGLHSDDACDWEANDRHSTVLMRHTSQTALLRHVLDSTTYYISLAWKGKASLQKKAENYFVLMPEENAPFSFSCRFMAAEPAASVLQPDFVETADAAATHWTGFWTGGAAVDFSRCTDPRAQELERRVVLSEYLLAIQCAGSTPPQETGLTYNSWFGKFHLEMIWWHQAWLALWGHPELLEHTLAWYEEAEPMARRIAGRQGFDGLRWMKMTDPSGAEAPSNVGSFLVWQQPHYIYLAELVYRARPSDTFLRECHQRVQATADFMYSFATYDESADRYLLKGLIPAQETLRAATTVNPPFELSYWHFALQVAQLWRERMGETRKLEWDELTAKLSPLAWDGDSLYLAAESATDTYRNIRLTSDHMTVLGAVGILPMNALVQPDIMKRTLRWVCDHWNWDKTWGWDYPMTAMNAARLGEPDLAVNALLMDRRTNTYLPNGHNYQDSRLRCYLPGNGGLLTAIALMCAGWDGCTEPNPGFPKDGKWEVRWEGLNPMP